MKKLLSTAHLRQMTLFDELLTREWVTLHELHQKLNYPTRTIYSDIQEMNDYAKPIVIKSSTAGFKLTIPYHYSPRYYFRQLIQKSREFSLIELAFFEKEKNLEDLSERLFISLSTTKRLIKKVNQSLKERHFQISLSPFSLVGDEEQILGFMYYYFSEKYYLPNEIFNHEQMLLLDQLTTSLATEVDKELNFASTKRINYSVYVHLNRIQRGHHSPVNNPLAADHWEILENAQFCNQFLTLFQIKLSTSILNQLYSIWFKPEYAYNFEHMLHLIAEQPELKHNYQLIHDLIDDFTTKFDLESSDNSNLIVDLFNLFHQVKQQPFMLYDKRKYFLRTLQTGGNNLFLLGLIKAALLAILPDKWQEFEMNELLYIIVTHWPELVSKVENALPKVSLYLLLDTDQEHSRFLKKEIESYSRVMSDVTIIQNYSQYLCESTIQENGILLTNIPGLTPQKMEMICFNELLSTADWEQLDKLQRKQQLLLLQDIRI